MPMRTTIDIDDDVLAATKDLAKAEGRSMGAVISDLARRALTQPQIAVAGGGVGLSPGMEETQMTYSVDDFPTLPANRHGLPVTGELVRRLQDLIDLEDAEALDHRHDREDGETSGSKTRQQAHPAGPGVAKS
jgi:hypothetical protein